MTHVLSQFQEVVTIRLDGKLNAAELYQDIKHYLDTRQETVLMALLDFSLVTALNPQIKQALYRALQHHRVVKIGLFGMIPDIQRDLSDVLPLMHRAHPVFVDITENDLRVKMGLIVPQAEKKLGGMLKYLNKQANATVS